MLLHFADQAPAARALAAVSGLEPVEVGRHRFPDGEVRIRLPARLPERVVVYRSLHDPNEKLVELLLTAHNARALGARHLTLVAPYLAYMRQDMAFTPGEAVSQRIVGQYLASLFEAAITVDPHLHRVDSLTEAIPIAQAVALSAAGALADHIVARRERPFLIGPDEESAQWVALAAARHGLDHAICRKVRRGDRDVSVELPPCQLDGRQVVIIDDMGSTGHTLAAAARLALAAGAASIAAAVTHALFVPGAMETVRAAGVSELWSADSVGHASNAISLAPLLAAALAGLQPATGPR
ncbi:MAG: ribose-phosphate diphosphokinase [Rubrivivax sp.]|nr:ribose-phosphate diphosphokinase [Rubrivivax sp.]